MGGRGSSGAGGGAVGASRAAFRTLTGSERQVSWANDILDTAYGQLDAMDRTLDRIEAQTKGRPRTRDGRTAAEELAGFTRASVRTVRAELNDTLSSVTSAKTIIDQRDNLSASRIRNLVDLESRTGQVSAARRRRR